MADDLPPWHVPHLLPADAATPFRAKRRPEDFRVEELPLFPPSERGDHVLFELEKRGVSTREAVRRLARELRVPEQRFGHAGLKDARAVTRQRLTVERVEPERLAALELDGLRVLEVARHHHKLEVGKLAGNRFVLALRDLPVGGVERLRAGLETLAREGLPNAFGAQRFGHRGDTGAIGRALLRRDFDGALALLAGRPTDRDTGPVREARERYDAGDWRGAAARFPRSYSEAVKVCVGMYRERGDARRAARALPKHALRLYVSAAQSEVFNRFLALRMPEPGLLVSGDVACLHESGGRFLVEDPGGEQPRADRLEISPTGPLPGRRISPLRRMAGRLERAALEHLGMERIDFEDRPPFGADGTQRPLRVPLGPWTLEEATDDLGPHAKLALELPPGSYATSVLEELGQDRLAIGEPDARPDRADRP